MEKEFKKERHRKKGREKEMGEIGRIIKVESKWRGLLKSYKFQLEIVAWNLKPSEINKSLGS